MYANVATTWAAWLAGLDNTTSGPVSTWMGDRLEADEPNTY